MKLHISKLIFISLLVLTMPLLAAPPRPAQPQFGAFFVAPDGALIVEAIAAGVYRTKDNGRHWAKDPETTDSSMDSGRPRSMLFSNQACNPKSYGASWTCLGSAMRINAIGPNGLLYKCSGPNIEFSRDAGESWQKLPTFRDDDSGFLCQAIAVHGKSIYVVDTSSATMYQSNDEGQRWKKLTLQTNDSTLIPGERIIGMMLDSGGTLYATTAGIDELHYRIYRYRSAISAWERCTFGLPGHWKRLTLKRALPDALYFEAAEAVGGGIESSLYRSEDGRSSAKMELGFPIQEVVDIQSGPNRSIYLATIESIYKSSDLGKSWSALNRASIHW